MRDKLNLPETRPGRPLQDEYKEAIHALAATGLNKKQIADKLGISWSTVDNYFNSQDPSFDKLREERKRRFIESCWDNIEEAIKLGNQKVLAAQEGAENVANLVERLVAADVDKEIVRDAAKIMGNLANIPLGHISTYIGTLYDKQALAQGDPTEITETKGVVFWEEPE